MKNIDIKSLLIGALLISTIFLGVAATGTTDEWDDGQQWLFAEYEDLKRMRAVNRIPGKHWVLLDGWEPWVSDEETAYFRKRIK